MVYILNIKYIFSKKKNQIYVFLGFLLFEYDKSLKQSMINIYYNLSFCWPIKYEYQ